MGEPERGGRALFADRDGTIIREREYLSDPGDVELLSGAAEGLARLHAAGFQIVIVTNQSGIARGYYDEGAYRAVQDEVVTRLGERGVPVLASYHCPHHPDFTGSCECRKPADGLFRRAAREHGLDLGESAAVGDRLRDVEPAVALGAMGVLVRTGYGAKEERSAPGSIVVADDLVEAADRILAVRRDR